VDWAEWNPAVAVRPWTVGIEEESMLLEPGGWSLVPCIGDVLAGLPPSLFGHASAETHACVVELATRPHRTVAEAIAELRGLRGELARALAGRGLRSAVAGTHPTVVWSDVEISPDPRYRHIDDSMRALAHREPTFALHVHVGVPDPVRAVRALDGIREYLPLLLALAANSPYWQGRDTGLASTRIPIFSMFPRVGIARPFGDYRNWVAAVDALVRGGAIPDPSFLWWDARLQPRLGTVEVRVMDAQTRVEDTAALAALVQSLVRFHAEGARRLGGLTPEALAEDRFLAARDGMAAEFVGGFRGRRPSAAERLAGVLDACAPVAGALGCLAELESAAELAESPGHARQRATVAARGLDALVPALSEDYALRRAPSP
jgi:glutamate---cysteine ligase / carboxylate-amine ligase